MGVERMNRRVTRPSNPGRSEQTGNGRDARPVVDVGEGKDLKETLIAEAHHRVANSLALAASMLSMQARNVTDEEAIAALRTAQLRLIAMAQVDGIMQRIGKAHSVPLSGFLHDLLPVIGESLGAEFMLAVGTEDIRVSGRMASRLGIALNELSLNAVKHAYRGESGGRITVRLDRTSEDLARIELEDGGAGFADGFDLSKQHGLGLGFVRALAEGFGGTLEARNNGGACFTLTFPPA